MDSGSSKILAAVVLIVASITLDFTSRGSPFAIGLLIVSFILAIAGAFVGFRGLFDFLSTRY